MAASARRRRRWIHPGRATQPRLQDARDAAAFPCVFGPEEDWQGCIRLYVQARS